MNAPKPAPKQGPSARKRVGNKAPAQGSAVHESTAPDPHPCANELQAANKRLRTQKKDLERLMQELIRHRDHLEELIGERARELKAANEYLGREITERARAEQELRQTNRLLEKVFSSINVHIAYMDTQFNFIHVNRVYAAAERYEPEFFIGKNHFTLFPNREHEELFRKVAETGEPYYIYGEPFRYFRGYRRTKEYWDWSLSPVKERDGTVSGLVLNLVNVTDRIRAEEALRESERKFRRLSQEFNILLDAIPDMILLLSPELKVLWANRGAAAAMNVSIQDITGQHCYALWHGRTTPCDNCHTLRCFASGKTESRQVTLPSGRLLDSRSFPIKDENGKVINTITIASDITEKMVLQAEVMRADHLASIGKLAAGVAHEINNPINGIINYAQILANKSAGGSRERDIAGRIIKEGDRIATIVRSLLSFARDHKEQKLPVHVKDILSDTLALTEAQLRKDGITLKLRIPDALPVVVANPQQIQQVFLNIISNAQYALNQRYQVKHSDKVLEVSCSTASVNDLPYVRTIFSDRGTGIPAEILERIKDPFFSTKPSGTGLGLSISYGIISDHGGRLEIRSAESTGTTVLLDLPAAQGDHVQ